MHKVNLQRNMRSKDEIYLSNSYARSLARVAGWKPLTKRMRGIFLVVDAEENESRVS